MQQEVWVEIKDYPNYAVSNFGRILNVKRDYFLAARSNDNGSLRVTLSDEGQTKDFYIHHLVADAFSTSYKPKSQVIHLNGDKLDNTPGNLRTKRRDRMVYSKPIKPREPREPRHWGKRMRIIETGDVFRTVRDCANFIEGDYASIYSCLRGDRQSHKGYTFEYYDEVDDVI